MKVNRKSGDAAVVLNQVVKQYTPAARPRWIAFHFSLIRVV